MIILHHAAQTRSFRILWFLHEAGLAHRVERHSFLGRALRSPEFLAKSPAGRVPAVEVDGQVLFESAAILEYLIETRAQALGRLAGDPLRGKFLEWLNYGETISQHIAQLTFHHIVLKPEDRSAVVQKLEGLRLRRTLEGVEAALADDYLAGAFSAADIMVGSAIELGRRFLRLDGLPKVEAYRARLVARPGYLEAVAQDGAPELWTQDFYG